MLTNYFRLAWRHLQANKIVSFINMFGLSIAIACSITVFLFLQNYQALDDFHEHGERIFMVEYVTEENGEPQAWGNPPAPIAEAMQADIPQVERTVRIQYEGVRIFQQENVFNELLTYADSGFFDMFTFPLQYGDPAALTDPSAIILSAEMAKKYFPDEIPIGRTITLVTGNLERKQFIVQGVAKPFPNNTGFYFQFLTGYHVVHERLKSAGWDSRSRGIFVQLHQPEDAKAVSTQIQRYLPIFNANNPETPISAFVLDNLRHPAPKAYNVINRPAEVLHPALTLVFSLIALAMMALSCFNYVNISLGAASRRLKEIGVRKVLGGLRRQLIGQFMAENLLLCFAALVFGLMLTEIVFIPLLNEIMVLKIALSFAGNATLWLFLVALLAFTALASGAYPALYISAFRPVAILAGKLKFNSKNVFRRGLLAIQFGLAFFAIIVTVVLLTAARQWENVSWGYDPRDTVVVQLTESRQFDLLKNELLKSAAVQGIAGSANHVGQSFRRENIEFGMEKQQIFCFDVGPDYPQVLGLDLRAGRFFDPMRRVEDETAVVVNEAFVRKQDWQQPVGKQVRIAQQDYTVIGVVGDFKIFGSGAVLPALFFRAEPSKYSYLIARFANLDDRQIGQDIEQAWQQLFPNVPANHFLQSNVFEGFYRAFRNVSNTFGYVAGLALLIACMGLYGLASQHFSRRLKEMGIRKLLGAPVAQIVLLVNREFGVLLVLAGVFASVLCFIGITILVQFAEEFTGPFQPGIGPFFLANVLVLLTAALAVGQQSWQVAKVNLAEVLKNKE